MNSVVAGLLRSAASIPRTPVPLCFSWKVSCWQRSREYWITFLGSYAERKKVYSGTSEY